MLASGEIDPPKELMRLSWLLVRVWLALGPVCFVLDEHRSKDNRLTGTGLPGVLSGAAIMIREVERSLFVCAEKMSVRQQEEEAKSMSVQEESRRIDRK